MIITIDGPAASGKSTIAYTVAQKLQFQYLNSGFLFRALTYLLAQKAGYVECHFEHPVVADIDFYADASRLRYTCSASGKPVVTWDDQDITSFLKDSSVDAFVSLLARNEYARTVVVDWQRRIAQRSDCVAEGRDTGSYVFPNAEYKFFIMASPVVRAARWTKDQTKRGNSFTQEQALELLTVRDRRDQERTIGRLVIPENAIIIDTSNLTLEQSVATIIALVRKRETPQE